MDSITERIFKRSLIHLVPVLILPMYSTSVCSFEALFEVVFEIHCGHLYFPL